MQLNGYTSAEVKKADRENFERWQVLFAKRLKEALDERGRGARARLAKAAGKSQSWVNSLLDRGGLEHWWELRVIAEELGRSVDYLLDRTDDPSPRRISGDRARANLERLDARELAAISILKSAVDALSNSIAGADLKGIGIEIDRDKPNGALTELLRLANLLPPSDGEER